MSQAAAESLLVFPPGDKEAFVKTQMRNSIHSGHSLDAILSKCSAQMKLMRVTPADEGLEDRTFECLKCHHIDTWIFEAL